MYQNIIVETGTKIYQKNNQLCIQGDVEHHIPIEDISTLLLANRQMSISAYSLEILAENGSAVILCNSSYQPSAILLPFAANSRRLKMIRVQSSQTKPKLKKLWQQIVQRKILNQGLCLKLAGKEDCISKMAHTVNSGDTKNVEAVAAASYFKVLFGNDFTRHDDGTINSVLNYGYAILRSSIARYLSIYGFEPCLGIFHHNELNSFNLADDLIEVFRPIVDLYASNYVTDPLLTVLTPKMRHDLVQILSCAIKSGDEIHSVNYAIERLVQSLMRCFTGKENRLLLPELIPLKLHSYE